MAKKEKKETEGKVEAVAKKMAVGTRGRTFQGEVVKKFGQRAVVDFERTVKISKYERFTKKKTRLHSRIPENMDVHVGDIVRVRECRPLSKIVHFVVIEKIKGREEK